LGDPAHADAADADEMDGADVGRQFHGTSLHTEQRQERWEPVFRPALRPKSKIQRGITFATRNTRSARRSAASSTPADFAPAAMAGRLPGSAARQATSLASRSGVKSS